MNNVRINIKPLSVNACFQGRRFKTQAYKDYINEVIYSLPKLKIPQGKLQLNVVFGVSSKNADCDNCLKPFLDILQEVYAFNDKQIYLIRAGKQDTEKGKEFVDFSIEKL